MKKKAKRKYPPKKFGPIALTGSGFKGTSLLRWLENDPSLPHVIFLDKKKPSQILKKTKFYKIDLTENLADVQLFEILKKEGIDTLVHTALPATPPRNSDGLQGFSSRKPSIMAEHIAQTGGVGKENFQN